MPRAHIIRALLLTHTSPTELYTLSLHDALPIWVHQTTTNGNGLAYGYIVIGKLFTGGFAGTVDRGAVLTDYKNLQFAIETHVANKGFGFAGAVPLPMAMASILYCSTRESIFL